MQMRIDEIIVKKRLRRELGNLDELSESIKKHGLLNPIVVSNKKVLIAGERRLEAAKNLGWQTIPVRIMDNPSRIQELEIEIDENIHRKPFNPDEAVNAYEKLARLKNPGFLRRVLNVITQFLKRFIALFH